MCVIIARVHNKVRNDNATCVIKEASHIVNSFVLMFRVSLFGEYRSYQAVVYGGSHLLVYIRRSLHVANDELETVK